MKLALSYEQFYQLRNRNDMMFKLIREKPRSAIELGRVLGLHRTTICAYLNGFVKSGKLEKRKKGRTVYYGVKKEMNKEKKLTKEDIEIGLQQLRKA